MWDVVRLHDLSAGACIQVQAGARRGGSGKWHREDWELLLESYPTLEFGSGDVHPLVLVEAHLDEDLTCTFVSPRLLRCSVCGIVGFGGHPKDEY